MCDEKKGSSRKGWIEKYESEVHREEEEEEERKGPLTIHNQGLIHLPAFVLCETRTVVSIYTSFNINLTQEKGFLNRV